MKLFQLNLLLMLGTGTLSCWHPIKVRSCFLPLSCPPPLTTLARRPVSLFLKFNGGGKGASWPCQWEQGSEQADIWAPRSCTPFRIHTQQGLDSVGTDPLCFGPSQLVSTFPSQSAQCSTCVIFSTCTQHFRCLLLLRILWTGSMKTHLCQCWLRLSEQK